MKKYIGMALLALWIFLPGNGLATTWGREESKCPVCETANKLQSPMSYGSYIYDWPEKYQFVFWPKTATEFIYHCKQCNFTCFMWDWELEGVTPDKIKKIRDVLRNIKIKNQSAFYTKIPIPARLEAAEQIYGVMGKDDAFWCDFYRVKGYHLEKEGDPKAATVARQKALDIAEKQAVLSENKGKRKEWLYICGAMKFFLDDVEGAKKYFSDAKGLKFKNPEMKKEDEKGFNDYLSGLIKGYLDALKDQKKSREIRDTGRTRPEG